MAPWPSGAGASGVWGSRGVDLSLRLVPYPMGSSGANGANGAASNGANAPVRMGKLRIQSVSQHPIEPSKRGSPAVLRAGHRLGQGIKPLISLLRAFQWSGHRLALDHKRKAPKGAYKRVEG